MFNNFIIAIRLKIRDVLSHKGFKKYFFNTSWLLFDKISRIFLGVFVGAWVARHLGPFDYGILNFALSFVGLFGTFSKLGLENIVVRNLVSEEGERDQTLGTAFVLKLFGALVLLVGVYWTLQLTSSTKSEKMIVMVIAWGQLFMSFDVIDYYFRSQVKAKYSSIAGTLGLMIASIVRVVFILLNLPLIWFAGAVAVEQIIKSFFFFYFYSKYIENRLTINSLLRWEIGKETTKELLKDSWSLIFSGLAVSLYMRIDQVIVKEILGNEAIGYYSVAVKLSESWLFITTSITQSLYPAIVSAKKISDKLYYSRIQKMYQLLVLFAVLVSLVFLFLSKPLILYLYGDAYTASISILVIYIWSNVFVFLNNGSWSWYITENLQAIATVRLLLGALLNVGLNIFLIERYGLEGAAYATIISYAIATYFGNLLFKKTWINFRMQTFAMINFLNIRSYFR